VVQDRKRAAERERERERREKGTVGHCENRSLKQLYEVGCLCSVCEYSSLVGRNQHYYNCILLDGKVLSAFSSSTLKYYGRIQTVRKRAQLGNTRTDLLCSCPPAPTPSWSCFLLLLQLQRGRRSTRIYQPWLTVRESSSSVCCVS
jgi:hypothetical protein